MYIHTKLINANNRIEISETTSFMSHLTNYFNKNVH